LPGLNYNETQQVVNYQRANDEGVEKDKEKQKKKETQETRQATEGTITAKLT